jgi:hypothetical protein
MEEKTDVPSRSMQRRVALQKGEPMPTFVPEESQAPPANWKEAVIAACVVSHLSWDENDPHKTIANLIAWETQIALDPKVSKEARDLQNHYLVAADGLAEALREIAEIDHTNFSDFLFKVIATLQAKARKALATYEKAKESR